MVTFTLDTNCVIDIDEGRAAALFVRQLVNSARDGTADVMIVASSASERQKDGGFLNNVGAFRERINQLGFGHIELLPPLLRWDIGFWDEGLWASDEAAARENLIYSTMFPNSPLEWVDYAAEKGVETRDTTSAEYRRWRNQILDAQAFWAPRFSWSGCVRDA